MEHDKSLPIAIVGMSCRFPGEASTIPGFWDMMSNAKSARTKVPSTRYNVDAVYHPSPDRQGAVITKEGCFLTQDVAHFDAAFFSITPNEADAIDPQHRILLECVYEGFESAGISIHDIAGSKTACYVGGFSNDYELISGADIHNQSQYQATGIGRSMLANRISWFYDLRGPSFVVDTACSSSMLALLSACRELQSGRSTMAIAAGASLILRPEMWRGLSAQRFLSPDGACHSFDSRANGYGRGEGFGVLIVKPLSDALRDNDVIRAVIRGIESNQDGKTPAITVPSTKAQMDLITSAYEYAGLDFADTHYFEAHGTGTAVGDPLELAAVGNTIGASRTEDDPPLYIGSVKSNIGHLEASSGIAGVIKTILILESGNIPAVAEFESPNPKLRLDDWNLSVPTKLTEWPTRGLRRASINSFGYGGSNAHLILDDALNYLKARGIVGYHNTNQSPQLLANSGSGSPDSGISILSKTTGTAQKPHRRIFVITSPEKDGLTRLAETYCKFFDSNSSASGIKGISEEAEALERLAFTLCRRRTIFGWRSFTVADSISSLQSSLDAGLAKFLRATKNPACGFLFTGQGAQWFAMGRELQTHAAFRNVIYEADRYISSLGSHWSVLEEFSRDKESSRINDPDISQPLCTVLQIALVDLLRHWGVTPKSVAGHSSGEIAAAYTAGAISKQDAWRIAYYRGLRSAMIPHLAPDRPGAMIAVALPESEAWKYINLANSDRNGQAIVACINSPESVTVSGDVSVIERVKDLLLADNIWCRKLQVKTAYHSPHMAIIADKYLDDIKDVTAHSGSSFTSIFSSVTGEKVDGSEMGPQYWIRNLVNPVKFSESVTALVCPKDSHRKRKRLSDVDFLVEIGPHAALQGPVTQILAAGSQSYTKVVSYLAMLKRHTDAEVTALDAAGRLWSFGFDVDLLRVNSVDADALGAVQHLVNLPSYPFNHNRRYWYDSLTATDSSHRCKPRTDLLGIPAVTSNRIHPVWRNIISPAEIPWLLDHYVHNLLLMPGAVFLAMALEGCREVADPEKSIEGYEFRDVLWHKPIILETPDSKIATLMQFYPHHHGTKASWSTWTRFSIISQEAGIEAVEHCSGLVQIKYTTAPDEVDAGLEAKRAWEEHRRKYKEVRHKPTMSVPVKGTYDKLAALGLKFGPTFRNLHSLNAGDGYGFCKIVVPDTAVTMPEFFEYPLPAHPTLIDAAFQALTCTSNTMDRGSNVMLPSAIGSLFISTAIPHTPGTLLEGYVTRTSKNQSQQRGTVVLSDSAWAKPLIVLKDIVTSAAPAAKPPSNRRPFGRIEWVVDNSHLLPQRWNGEQSRNRLTESENCGDFCLRDKVTQQLIQETLHQDILPASCSSLEEAVMAARGRCRSLMQSLQALQATEIGVKLNSKIMNVVATNITNQQTTNAQPPLLTKVATSNVAVEGLNRLHVDEAVAGILMQAGHVNPRIQILEIGIPSSPSDILRLLKDHMDLIGRYILTSKGDESVELAENSFQKLSRGVAEFGTLNIEQSVKDHSSNAGTMDYVILDDLTLATYNLKSALRAIKVLLKPGGRLVIQTVSKAQIETGAFPSCSPKSWHDLAEDCDDLGLKYLGESGWHSFLKQNGFTGVDYAVHNLQYSDTIQASILVSSTEQELLFEPAHAVVLCPSSQSRAVTQLINNTVKNLQKLGVNVEREYWESAADLDGKVVICFLELDDPVLETMKENLFLSIQQVAIKPAAMLWITRGGYISGDSLPGFSVCTGLFRAIRSENSTRRIFTLDLSSNLDLYNSRAADIVIEIGTLLWDTSDQQTRDWEFAEDEGLLHVPRLVEDIGLNAADASEDSAPRNIMEKLFQTERPLKMAIRQMGSFDSLHFVDNDEFMQGQLKPDWVDIQVEYTGLNFVDVMAVLGEVPPRGLGSEMGGVITAVGSSVKDLKVGDRVVGPFVGAFRTHIRMRRMMVFPVPSTMTHEEAVGVIIPFSTAWIGLVEKAKIQRGESILIHSGAGGVGQAAIQVCQHFGLEIFVSVGSIAKRDLLMRRYGIPQDHIFSSRDISFAQGILRMTGGRGVDVVLNSLAGELLRQSWHLVANFGRFVEIGKRDMISNTGLDMEPFLRNVTFIGFNLTDYEDHMEKHAEALRKIFKLLESGELRAIYPITTMSYGEIPKAFRALRSGEVQGKILLKTHSDDVVPVAPRIQHKLSLDKDATYLLSGGLGGIGRSIATMFMHHGAKNLAFFTKSGDSKESAKSYLNQLRSNGVNANAYACDVSDRVSLADAIARCSAEMPPLKGIVQCAMVLRDGLFEKMSFDDWEVCIKPKIHGSWNLHQLLPSTMDFFILLASASGIIGNPGQANYSAGNTFEDSLALYRRRRGLSATALDLGAVRDVGYLAETEDPKYWNLPHIQKLSISEHDIHFLIKRAILDCSTGGGKVSAQIVSGLVGAEIDPAMFTSNVWARDAKFRIVWKVARGGANASAELDRAALLKAHSIDQAAEIVRDILLQRVAAAVVIPVEELSSSEPLETYGVNSLVAVEVKTWLTKEFQCDISVTEVTQLSISMLAQKIVLKSSLLVGRFKPAEEVNFAKMESKAVEGGLVQ